MAARGAVRRVEQATALGVNGGYRKERLPGVMSDRLNYVGGTRVNTGIHRRRRDRAARRQSVRGSRRGTEEREEEKQRKQSRKHRAQSISNLVRAATGARAIVGLLTKM